MSCLDATFTLTPRSPWYFKSVNGWADLDCYGADVLVANPWDLSSLYSTDRFYFDPVTAADPNIDYTQGAVRITVPRLRFTAKLGDFGAAKQLALIFGFDAPYSGWVGRVLVYNDGGRIHDQTLAAADNQFLFEIETLDYPIYLDFIHAGGAWFFRGLSGYVV